MMLSIIGWRRFGQMSSKYMDQKTCASLVRNFRDVVKIAQLGVATLAFLGQPFIYWN
jgi:hypothetical protein